MHDDPSAEESAPRGHTRAGFLKRVAIAGAGTSVTGSILAACGGGGDNNASATQTAAPTAAGGGGPIAKVGSKYDNKKIGVFIITAADENVDAISRWCKTAAKEAGLNWKWNLIDTQGDQAKGGAAMQTFITQKVDGIIDIAVGAGGIESQLKAAKDAKIPVVGTYTFASPTSSILNDYTLPPDTDATLLAHYMCKDLYKRHPSGDIEVVMLDFPVDIISGRRSAFKAVAGQHDRIKIVGENFNVSATSTAESASSAAQAAVRGNPNLKAIWCNYPPIAINAASGVEQTGKDVKVYGHIANSAGVEAVRSGTSPLVATSWVDWPYMAYTLVDQLLAAFSGKELDRALSYLRPDPAIVFDKTNVEREVPKGTKAADWQFGGGTYRQSFIKEWGETYT